MLVFIFKFYEHLGSSLTRARGELLRRKIEQRPSRERLVTQRILLSDGRVAPLIEQKARLLKKDRIRSSLDKKLSRRPGPLELVTKKILIADAELERDIEGTELTVTQNKNSSILLL